MNRGANEITKMILGASIAVHWELGFEASLPALVLRSLSGLSDLSGSCFPGPFPGSEL